MNMRVYKDGLLCIASFVKVPNCVERTRLAMTSKKHKKIL